MVPSGTGGSHQLHPIKEHGDLPPLRSRPVPALQVLPTSGPGGRPRREDEPHGPAGEDAGRHCGLRRQGSEGDSADHLARHGAVPVSQNDHVRKIHTSEGCKDVGIKQLRWKHDQFRLSLAYWWHCFLIHVSHFTTSHQTEQVL